jgi:N-acetylmuramoyl-L-alanine amidase
MGIWQFQRDEYWGFIEDLNTPIVAQHLVSELSQLGHEVKLTRPLPGSEKGDEIGQSGHPRWMEGALYYLRDVWADHPEYKEKGSTDRGKDLYARPLFANMWCPNVVVSLHHNASDANPAARGTTIYYKSEYTWSEDLAKETYGAILNRGEYDGDRRSPIKPNNPGWVVFKALSSSIPCILVEFLFFSNESDNSTLQNGMSLAHAGEAIAEAIDESRTDWV